MDNKGNDKNLNFSLENRHYQNIDLILYLVSVLLVIIIFLITHTFIESYILRTIIIAVFSLILGVLLVYKRNMYRRKLSELANEQKRTRIKTGHKQGLKTTLRRITPKNNNLNLKIKERISFGDKLINMKDRFMKKKKKDSEEYIEIKD